MSFLVFLNADATDLLRKARIKTDFLCNKLECKLLDADKTDLLRKARIKTDFYVTN